MNTKIKTTKPFAHCGECIYYWTVAGGPEKGKEMRCVANVADHQRHPNCPLGNNENN